MGCSDSLFTGVGNVTVPLSTPNIIAVRSIPQFHPRHSPWQSPNEPQTWSITHPSLPCSLSWSQPLWTPSPRFPSFGSGHRTDFGSDRTDFGSDSRTGHLSSSCLLPVLRSGCLTVCLQLSWCQAALFPQLSQATVSFFPHHSSSLWMVAASRCCSPRASTSLIPTQTSDSGTFIQSYSKYQ